MSAEKETIITIDPWQRLNKFTEARIGLGRCGTSLPHRESLAFKLAHARARDAVHQKIEPGRLLADLQARGYRGFEVCSAVRDRGEYLTRPDLGRQLAPHSAAVLEKRGGGDYDLCLIICDGLSGAAVDESALDVAVGFLEEAVKAKFSIAPVCVVTNGRVAIGDVIGESLGARMAITLIGERPGLSSPNSLGVYLTYRPRIGTTDEARNCISNIRPGGMSIARAVRKIAYLVEEAFKLGTTGIALKDEMREHYLPFMEQLGR